MFLFFATLLSRSCVFTQTPNPGRLWLFLPIVVFLKTSNRARKARMGPKRKTCVWVHRSLNRGFHNSAGDCSLYPNCFSFLTVAYDCYIYIHSACQRFTPIRKVLSSTQMNSKLPERAFPTKAVGVPGFVFVMKFGPNTHAITNDIEFYLMISYVVFCRASHSTGAPAAGNCL